MRIDVWLGIISLNNDADAAMIAPLWHARSVPVEAVELTGPTDICRLIVQFGKRASTLVQKTCIDGFVDAGM